MQQLDECDADLMELKWTPNRDGYLTRIFAPYVKRRGSTKFLHRMIMERVLGRPLGENERVDHRDLDVLNNCRSNLRLATRSQNSANTKRRSDNKTGYKGVCWNVKLNKYMASIMQNGKSKHLGYFTTAEEAHKAYCEAALEVFGEFARFE